MRKPRKACPHYRHGLRARNPRAARNRNRKDNAMIETGKTYKIIPRYSHSKTVVIRVRQILHQWTDENSIDYIAVWAYRVRPQELNVSFGNGKGYVFRISQAQEIETEIAR
jgi:predicted transcriptional regulator